MRFVWNQWLGLSGKTHSGEVAQRWNHPSKFVLTAKTLSGGVCLKSRTLSRERLAGWKTKHTIWWAFFGKTLSGKVCLTSRTVLSGINLCTVWLVGHAEQHLAILNSSTPFRETYLSQWTPLVRYISDKYTHQSDLAWHKILYCTPSGSVCLPHGWRKKGIIHRGGGATYVALSLLEYISAFAARVLQCTSVCVKGEIAWAQIFKFLRTQASIPPLFLKKIITLKIIWLFHLFNAHHWRFQTCYLLNTRNRFLPPLHAYKNFASGELRLLDVSGTSHFHWLLVV